MSAAQLIADAIADTCDVDQSVSFRPNRLEGRMAFVEPAETWKEIDEDSFCRISVGLVAWLVASTTDSREAVEWLDDQSTSLMLLDRIDVGSDSVSVGPVGPPVLLVQDAGKASFLACRVEFSRFTLEGQ